MNYQVYYNPYSYYYFDDYWGVFNHRIDIKNILLPTIDEEKPLSTSIVIPEDILDYFPKYKTSIKIDSDLNTMAKPFEPSGFFNFKNIVEDCLLETPKSKKISVLKRKKN